MTAPAATPVPVEAPKRTSRGPRWAALVVILGALGFLLVQGLGSATRYFRTADEAVAQRDRLGSRRFRIEGVVVDGSVRQTGSLVSFLIQSRGVTVPVEHRGDPPELFRPGIPVVLEGRFLPGRNVFHSDRLMVKHSETYIARHPDRVTVPPRAPPSRP